jgi:hypothetical protein
MRRPHLFPCAVACLLFISVTGAASAADFGFSVIIQAGGSNTWELGIGPRGGAPAVTVSLNPYYQGGNPQQFQVGYTQSTNTAFVRFYNNGASYQQASYQPAGALPLQPGGTWSLPAGNFSANANYTLLATSISVANLGLSSGLTVLQPLTTTSLYASQAGWFSSPGPPVTLPSPVVFRAQGAGGNWLLSGTLTFTNLGGIFGLGANDGDLSFQMDAQASDVPEPSTALFMACGLLLIGIQSFRRRQKCPVPSNPPLPPRT